MPDKNQQPTDTNQTTNTPANDQGNLDIPNSAPAPEPILPNIPTPKDTKDAKDSKPADIKLDDKSDAEDDKPIADPDGTIAKIVGKIADSHNILIALSADPSVDEISSAIGLSLFLDKLGKRATAIYSGATPNALEFLKPGETFETSADTLQDFVIAINKEKADHLRYKLDGDYVRIYITPYRTKVSKDDLEFSYGDFNVDLVLALDVANGADLDQALREHGRIMHDATVVDITTGNPGRLGEIEWSDKTSSSVSEMISKMIYSMDVKEKIGRDEATAFLTGIVASTNRFSAPNTSAETMRIASKLMESGADQQLISKNISTELESELYGTMSNLIEQKTIDPTALEVEHEGEASETAPAEAEAPVEAPTEPETPAESIEEAPAEASTDLDTPSNDDSGLEIDHSKPEEEAPVENEAPAEVETPAEEVPTEAEAPAETPAEPQIPEAPTEPEAPVAEDPSLLEDLKSAQDSLAGAGAEVTPVAPAEETLQIPTTDQTPEEEIKEAKEKVITPSPDFSADNNETKYGKMLEDALAEPTTMAMPQPIAPPMPPAEPTEAVNPAASIAPNVTTEPDLANLPDINYAADGDMLLPPPPTPPIDFDANSLPTPDLPTPPMPAPGDMPPDFDPSSFQIPGM